MTAEVEFHNVDAAPTHVAPFSHAVECDGWIQLTGQMPTDPDDDTIVHWGRVEAGKPPVKIGSEWFVHKAEEPH